MKKQKVCALLCVAALSTATVTPTMAADNVADAQAITQSSEVTEKTEASEATPDVQEEQDSQNADETVQEETPEQEEQKGTVQNAQDAGNTPSANENSALTAQNGTAAAQSGEGEEEAEVKNGWYEDEDGNYFYYENDKMFTNVIAEIEDEDGTHGYYFGDNGIMLRDSQEWISYWDKEKQEWITGYIWADENGYLRQGWYGDEYFGSDYTKYRNQVLEEGDNYYYFDSDGKMLRNQEVVVQGVLYRAGDDGILTLVDTKGQNGWKKSGEDWYYYKDGKMLQDTFEVINGSKYYFYYNGVMASGHFWVNDNEYWAEPGGQIVEKKNTWHYSGQLGKWLWFNSEGVVVRNQVLKIGDAEYYFDWDGIMQTGVFTCYADDEKDKVLYANTSGAIDRSQGWKLVNGSWYYVKANGEAAHDEIITVGGKRYYMSSEGIMQSGNFYVWDGEKSYEYYTDNSGVIITNNWVLDQLEWYFTDNEGNILKNQWHGDFYLTETGSMAVGVTQIGDKTFIFDENGHKVMTLEDQKTGWHLADGDWYYVDNGTLPTGWKDDMYYLENGKMLTNSLVPAKNTPGRYSYVGQDGTCVSGWVQRMNDWMYLEKDEKTGDIVAVNDGWRNINGTRYYFEDGFMVSNDLVEINGTLNKFSGSGAWQGEVKGTCWVLMEYGDWRYVENGSPVEPGKKTINGATYYFEGRGYMKRNSALCDEKTGNYYWINNDGHLDTTAGWKKTPWNEWFYVENGKLVSGTTKKIGGTEYTFYTGGHMIASTLEYNSESGKYFLHDESGKKIDVSREGWYKVTYEGEAIWYYFKDGKPYDGMLGNYFLSYGRMITGIYGTSKGLYLFDQNGILQKNGWKLYDGSWYYAGTTGRLYTGEHRIGGVKYVFDRNGRWVK